MTIKLWYFRGYWREEIETVFKIIIMVARALIKGVFAFVFIPDYVLAEISIF